MISRFRDLPLRRQIILAILASLIVVGLIIYALSLQLEHRAVTSLAETRVRQDLESARAIYASFLENVMTVVAVAAERNIFRQAGNNPPDPGLGTVLGQTARIGRLDFLTYADVSGRVIARSDPAARGSDVLAMDSFFNRIAAGESISATRLLSVEFLRRESPLLGKDAEENTLMIFAAVPVLSPNADVVGFLYGGRRINGRDEFVDRIMAAILKDERAGGRPSGAVTIYQGETRISTTLEDEHGRRAIGTQADPEFRGIIRRHIPWIGRTRVLGERYLAAADPLRDYDGGAVGMMAIGLAERPFLALRNKVVLQFVGFGIIGAAIVVIFLSVLMSRFVRPLGEMAEAASRIAQGDLNLQVNVPAYGEIGELAGAFNRMTSELRRAKEHLLQWTWTLENRVADRTRELQNIQESMARSEKLASLGQLSAGIAHEINNPLTAILLNTHLLLEKVKPDDPAAAGLRLIAEETQRCAQIVRGLLDYSRQAVPQKSLVDINDLLERTIALLSGQAWARNIRIVPALDRSLPTLSLDGAKIQQVFWNLILNACEAMPNGGEIHISSGPSPDGRRIELHFADTGPGIPEENLSRIFDPFFTTKPSGTGLGMAVAQGIVVQHGGTISVHNQVGRGAVFTIQWPYPGSESGDKGIIP